MPVRKPLSFATRSPALILLVVAFATRWLALGNPILHVDEQFYFLTAHGWAHGALPFTDIWDRKPVGLFLLYLPAAMLPLGAGIWAYQIMALLSAWATALLIARMAGRGLHDPARGPLLAGIAYLVWTILAEGQGGQSPIFYNLLTALAANLLIGRTGENAPRLGDQALAMLLVGLAIQINTIVVLEGVFFGMWALWRHWQSGRSTAAIVLVAVALATIAVLPTLAAMGGYAKAGHFDDWWYANVQSIRDRNADPFTEQAYNLAGLVAILSPLVSMAVIGLLMRDLWRSTAYNFLTAWLIASVGTVLMFGTWFDHYGLRVMLPASIAAAAAMAAHPHIRRWAPWVLAFIAVGGQVLLIEKLWRRGTHAQFAHLVDAVGHGPGCLYIYDGHPMLYAYAGRCTLTRYLFPSHLTRNREAGAIGVDQSRKIARIFAHKPAIVVVDPPFGGENRAIRRQLLSLLKPYRLKALVRIGHHQTQVFELPGADTPAPDRPSTVL